MSALLHDLRYAARQLVRAPGFAFVAVITLALGIGANTAIFGVVDDILLEPLPFADADRIMTLWRNDPVRGLARDDVAPADFLDWRERSDSFELLAAVEPFSMDHVGIDGPERFRTWLVTEGFLRVFGTQPAIGRAFRVEDHAPGSDLVALLSHWLWQSRFGGDPDIVGSVLTLDGRPATIVGVMPPEFGFPPGRDMWVPRVMQGWEALNRTSAFWQVVGKLKPGIGLEAARAELDAIAAQLAREHPQSNTGIGIAVVPLTDYLVGSVRPALLLFWAAVGLVLLIACVNVANLLLARAVDRQREFALRAVLGADRVRVMRQLVTESMLLAGFGGAAGLVLAAWALGAVDGLRPDGVLGREPLSVDGRAIVFTSLIALGTVLVFGLAPAFGAARTNLRGSLHSAAQAATRGARRLRAALVVAELALAMMLLVGAGLLMRSFMTLQEIDRGFRADGVLAVTVQAWDYYPDLAQRTAFVEQTLERIGGLPGVQAAGVTSSLPLAEAIGADTATFTITGQPVSAADGEPIVHASVVTEGYFDALRIPLRAGRAFAATDDGDSSAVVLINETMARRYWPGQSAVGAELTFAFSGPPVTASVVGIVGDVRQSAQDDPRPSLYVPHAQRPTGALHFTVRADGDAAALLRPVQREIWTMNSAMPIEGAATLEGLLTDSLGERRFSLFLVLVFSAAALVLAAVGTYGLLSYDASRRAREIGVRMALGADGGSVAALVMRSGLGLALAGIAIGAAGALATSWLLSAFLFGVGPLDMPTFGGVAALLIAVAALASYLPARRAARIDPMAALRQE